MELLSFSKIQKIHLYEFSCVYIMAPLKRRRIHCIHVFEITVQVKTVLTTHSANIALYYFLQKERSEASVPIYLHCQLSISN